MAVVADRGDLQPCDPVSAWILATGDEQAGGIGDILMILCSSRDKSAKPQKRLNSSQRNLVLKSLNFPWSSFFFNVWLVTVMCAGCILLVKTR